jgi:ribonuclease D
MTNSTPLTNASAIQAWLDRKPADTRTCLDTESNSQFVFQEEVCLLQLQVAEQEPLLIDSLAVDKDDIRDLLRHLNSDGGLLVHGGAYDIGCIKRDYGVELTNLHDTQEAALLLGIPKTGLGALVEQATDIHLAKAHTDFNWGLRPLPEEALAYAADDVRYLTQVIDWLKPQLIEKDLLDEWQEACAQIAATPPHGSKTVHPLWRLKDLRRLNDQQLGIAAALLEWRSERAEAVNIPPGRVLPNALIPVLAKQQPGNFGLLKRMRLKERFLRQHGEDLINFFNQHRSKALEVPPRPMKPDLSPNERERRKKREERLKQWRKSEATKRAVSLQAILPSRCLDALVALPAGEQPAWSELPGFGARRSERYIDTLSGLLAR